MATHQATETNDEMDICQEWYKYEYKRCRSHICNGTRVRATRL